MLLYPEILVWYAMYCIVNKEAFIVSIMVFSLSFFTSVLTVTRTKEMFVCLCVPRAHAHLCVLAG